MNVYGVKSEGRDSLGPAARSSASVTLSTWPRCPPPSSLYFCTFVYLFFVFLLFGVDRHRHCHQPHCHSPSCVFVHLDLCILVFLFGVDHQPAWRSERDPTVPLPPSLWTYTIYTPVDIDEYPYNIQEETEDDAPNLEGWDTAEIGGCFQTIANWECCLHPPPIQALLAGSQTSLTPLTQRRTHLQMAHKETVGDKRAENCQGFSQRPVCLVQFWYYQNGCEDCDRDRQICLMVVKDYDDDAVNVDDDVEVGGKQVWTRSSTQTLFTSASSNCLLWWIYTGCRRWPLCWKGGLDKWSEQRPNLPPHCIALHSPANALHTKMTSDCRAMRFYIFDCAEMYWKIFGASAAPFAPEGGFSVNRRQNSAL